MTTLTKLNQISEKYLEHLYKYKFVGIRVQESSNVAGEVIKHKSNVWVDGKKTKKKLNGVCAIDITDIQDDDYSAYSGSHIVLLGSDSAEQGQDFAEIIMHNPIVIEVIEL